MSVAGADVMIRPEAPRTGLGSAVARRRFPYPYRAMLAISSDLDETPDRHVYWEITRFLNTSALTAIGRGLDLEFGNSLYFDMPPNQFAYWNTDDVGRQMCRSLMRSGHIDTLHSFGDLATTRAHAAHALEELSAHGCAPEVWIDHATAASNFGGDIMRGSGDVPGAAAYHADLTHAFGVRYVWRGRVTSVIAQDVPRSMRGVFNPGHPAASLRTIAKEVAKGVLGRTGSAKYRMHARNDVVRPIALRSGHRVIEFLRSNPCWRAVDRCATADGLAEVLAPPMLTRLVRREGVCVLYTHLGKISDPLEPFSPATRNALRRLADESRQGRILVTTTRRLLGYCRAARDLRYRVVAEGEGVRIEVTSRDRTTPLNSRDLAGLTFHVPDPARARIVLDGRDVSGIERHGPDHTGRPSVAIPWTRLEFPDQW